VKHVIVDLLEGMIRLRAEARSGHIEAAIDASSDDEMGRLEDAMESAIAGLDAIPFPMRGDVATGARIAMAQEAIRQVLTVVEERRRPLIAT